MLKPCKHLLLEYLLLRINKELKSLRLEAKDALLDSKGLLFTSTSSAAVWSLLTGKHERLSY